MNQKANKIRARLMRVQMYQRLGSTSRTCRKCGISAPTLRLWLRRYQSEGTKG